MSKFEKDLRFVKYNTFMDIFCPQRSFSVLSVLLSLTALRMRAPEKDKRFVRRRRLHSPVEADLDGWIARLSAGFCFLSMKYIFFDAFNIPVKQLFGKKTLIFLTAPWMVNAVTKIGFSKKKCWIYVDPHVGASVPRRRWSCCTCSMWRCSSRSRSWKRGWPRRGRRAWAPSRRCRKHFYTQAFVRCNVNKWLQCYLIFSLEGIISNCCRMCSRNSGSKSGTDR